MLNAVLVQEFQALLGLVVSWPTPLVQPIGIVQFSRAIYGYSNKKIVLTQKLTPSVGQQRAIGLQRIGNSFARRNMLLLNFDYRAEEPKA